MNITKELYDTLVTLKIAALHDDGSELHNPIPIEVPMHLKRPLTLAEQIKRVLRVEVSKQAESQGYETYAEADDFDTGEDIDHIDTTYTLMDEDYRIDPEAPVDSSEAEKSPQETKNPEESSPPEVTE